MTCKNKAWGDKESKKIRNKSEVFRYYTYLFGEILSFHFHYGAIFMPLIQDASFDIHSLYWYS